jgi:hypothetical protein
MSIAVVDACGYTHHVSMTFLIGSHMARGMEGVMLRMKVRQIREGLHPSEVVVEFDTADGERQTLVVDRRSLREDTLRVGYPIGRAAPNQLLIELPRESLQGRWRVWVSNNDVIEDRAA